MMPGSEVMPELVDRQCPKEGKGIHDAVPQHVAVALRFVNLDAPCKHAAHVDRRGDRQQKEQQVKPRAILVGFLLRTGRRCGGAVLPGFHRHGDPLGRRRTSFLLLAGMSVPLRLRGRARAFIMTLTRPLVGITRVPDVIRGPLRTGSVRGRAVAG